MKIDNFNLDLLSSRSYSETSRQQVTREFQFMDLVDQNMNKNMGQTPLQVPSQTTTEPVTTRPGNWYRPVLLAGQPAVELTDKFMAEMEKMRQMLDAIMDAFSKMTVIRQSTAGGFDLSQINQLNGNYSFGNLTPSAPRLVGYEYSESSSFSYYESEKTSFSASGVVNTTDGNEINFSLEMEMARSFFREESFSWTEKGAALIDPLIVNAGVSIPEFSGVGFSFDLDLDGNLEEILAPAQGTGFLSLDKNKDGVINDGSELFGPSTEDGFGELAAYDLDKNSWIDENDAVFDELTLYGLDENGEMHLTRIKDAGMGAIYLGGVDTAFDLKNRDNELLAKIKKSSIALNEDGSARTVQEADWAV